MTSQELPLRNKDLQQVFDLKYGQGQDVGWGPRLRLRFKYFNPDDYYEAMVAKLVGEGCAWVDLGCGRELFPDNQKLARVLADRCETLVGVDPDATLEENQFVHQRARSRIEDFQTEQRFMVITLRMVVEHITEPEKVVVFTVNQWSPLALLARLIPFRFHHALKNLVWRTEEKDTFPVAYRMNTRERLAQLFGEHGFKERYFTYLDDCRTSARFRLGQLLELACWRVLKALGLRYPENCLLGVYERL